MKPEQGRITVCLDRDPEIRELPAWCLNEGHVDYGYALTGHKAQGITCDRTFTVITGTTHREWAYVALSRGRQANTLYVTTLHHEEQCTHLTHATQRAEPDEVSRLLDRSSIQTAATDHTAQERTLNDDGIDPLQPSPPTEEMERVLRALAQHRTRGVEAEPGVRLGISR